MTPGHDQVEVVVPIQSTAPAAIDFLRLGAEARVLGPPDPRAAMMKTANQLATTQGRPTGAEA